MSADPKGLLPGEKVARGEGQGTCTDLFLRQIIWDGTTWPHGLFSWCCCSQNFFTVSNKSIKTATGCCKSKEDVMDMRRVTDIQFERSCFQLLCCRGTVVCSFFFFFSIQFLYLSRSAAIDYLRR